MNTKQTGPRSLREIENEVMAEGRAWTRQRLQERLQAEANRHGGVFPPQRKSRNPSAHPDDANADRSGGR